MQRININKLKAKQGEFELQAFNRNIVDARQVQDVSVLTAHDSSYALGNINENHSECKRNLIPKPLLQGELPDGEQVWFAEKFVVQDYESGFTSLQASQKEIANFLLASKRIKKEGDKGYEGDLYNGDLIASEIQQAFENFPKFQTLLWKMYVAARDVKQADYDNYLVTIFEECKEWQAQLEQGVIVEEESLPQFLKRKKLKNSLKILKQKKLALSVANEKLKLYCGSSDTLVLYAKAIEKKKLWLGHEIALLYAQYKEINLYVWRKKSENSTCLVLVDYYKSNKSRPVIHMLHNNKFSNYGSLVKQDPSLELTNIEQNNSRSLNDEIETNKSEQGGTPVNKQESQSENINDTEASTNAERESKISELIISILNGEEEEKLNDTIFISNTNIKTNRSEQDHYVNNKQEGQSENKNDTEASINSKRPIKVPEVKISIADGEGEEKKSNNTTQFLSTSNPNAKANRLPPSFWILWTSIKTDPYWWTPIFTVMLAADLIQYQTEEDHYGNTLLNTLLGLPIASLSAPQTRYNQAAWMNKFFTDDVTNAFSYWAGIGLVMARPLVTYAVLQFLRRNWSKPLEEKTSINKLNAYVPNFFEDYLMWFVPYGGIPHHIMRIEHALKYDKSLSQEDQEDMLKALLKIANQHKYQSQSYARDIFLSVIKKYDENHVKIMDLFSLSENNSIADQIQSLKLADKAYARKFKKGPYFLLLSLSLIQFWELVYIKVSTAIQEWQLEASCKSEGKDYQYHTPLGHPACTLCASWENIHLAYQESNDVKKCIDSLLAEQRPFDTIFEKFSKLFKYNYNNFFTIDLSHQNWAAWENSEWDSLLNLVSQYLVEIDTLDLSTQSLALVNDNMSHKITSLHNFLRTIPINTLIISGQQLGQDVGSFFFQGLQNSNLSTILASNIRLGDAGAFNLKAYLPAIKAKTLDLSYNQLTHLEFLPASNQTSITDLNISGNTGINCASIYPIFSWLYNKNLLNLDLSLLNLAGKCSEDLGKAVAASNLFSLRLVATQLSNAGIYYFATALINACLKILDISRNSLSPEAQSFLLGHLNKNMLEELNLADTALTYESMPDLVQFGSNSQLKKLNIASNKFETRGWELLTNNFTNMTLAELDASSNYLDDSNIDSLIENLSNRININLSNNQITSTAGLKFLKTQAKLGAEIVDLSNNLLDDQFTENAAAIISLGKFTHLIFKDNNMGSNIAALIKAAPDTLNVLDISFPLNNNVKEQLGNAFLQNPYSFIGKNKLNSDEGWRFSQAKSANALTNVIMSPNQMNDENKLGLCRVTGQTNTQIKGLGFTDSSEQITLPYCQTSSATRLQPWFIFSIPTLLMAQISNSNEKTNNDSLSSMLINMFILYVIYQALKAFMKPSTTNNQRFFKIPNDRVINEKKNLSKTPTYK